MRIAQVAPLYESVPPKAYGGTERVVSYLTEELVRQGHEVTLFASGDSETNAALVPVCASSLRLDDHCVDQLCHHIIEVDMVREQAEDFDIIHFHIDYLHFPTSRFFRVPHLTTLHGRLDLPDLVPLYKRYSEVPVVSISDSQRRPFPRINWQGTVYHGLPDKLYDFHSLASDSRSPYLAFLGRISPEKRVDRAIEIAQGAGMALKIAAKVDPVDQEYFDSTIKPLLDKGGASIEFIGEIGERDKGEFLRNAHALLFPIDWPEPFGMVMIEAMACGTPVVAWNCGSVPEVITAGESGYICNTIEEAIDSVKRVATLSREGCRRAFENRFRAAQMANSYVQLYERLINTQEQIKAHCYAGDHSGPESVLHSGVSGATRRT